jgi:phage tail sheath protein FI
MKTILLFVITFFSCHRMIAQVSPLMKKEATSLDLKRNSTLRTQKTVTEKDLKSEITDQLQKILDRYAASPNEESTWKQIRNEASDILTTHFRNGKLVGSQPAEAFYVSMGPQTMTAADIANHRLILIAGVALVKPSEFEIITVTAPHP